MRCTWPLIFVVALQGCAPPGCEYRQWSLVIECPDQEAAAQAQAEAAQQEQQRQTLVAQLGGERNYEVYENAQAWKQWNWEFQASMNYCIQQAGIPVTEYQDNYIKQHCLDRTMSILGPKKPRVLP